MREGNDMTKQLKAATIAHELLYDSCASRAMFETPGLLQALVILQEVSGSRDDPVEGLLRLLTAEVMKHLLKEFCLEL